MNSTHIIHGTIDAKAVRRDLDTGSMSLEIELRDGGGNPTTIVVMLQETATFHPHDVLYGLADQFADLAHAAKQIDRETSECEGGEEVEAARERLEEREQA